MSGSEQFTEEDKEYLVDEFRRNLQHNTKLVSLFKSKLDPRPERTAERIAKWLELADAVEEDLVWVGLHLSALGEIDLSDHVPEKSRLSERACHLALESFNAAWTMFKVHFRPRNTLRRDMLVSDEIFTVKIKFTIRRVLEDFVAFTEAERRGKAEGAEANAKTKVKVKIDGASAERKAEAVSQAKKVMEKYKGIARKTARQPLSGKEQGALWLDRIEKLHLREDFSDDFLRRRADAKQAGEVYSQYDQAAASEEQEQEEDDGAAAGASAKESSDGKTNNKKKNTDRKKKKKKKKKN
ncbi:Hypothetical Protein FCC1311_112102 [Hondaea fermentalgiana]|uniref:Uncharacterized protein n=1 Tax=Hondaea fermentalgiana TaxID=2315210 RepID=A0A2R5GYU8_9STRA|nr:Hypothetical Protein FCC1311_112102 [Hondaea fermentalgiana]|eukprot:GBG34988.1 Hypothetical Protein FCC1311_112102 [Hondaea fermentalgiana]